MFDGSGSDGRAADVLVEDGIVRAVGPDLEIEISVLSSPRLAASVEDFDPIQSGVYLVIGQHAGFFLPQVARETGWGREQLLDRLCTEKLGLPPQSWRGPEARLYTFDVEVVGPERV